MLFNSFEFILLFLPITFFVYFQISERKKHELAIFWLVLASLFFYSWWKPIYIFLIISSILFNYVLGVLLERERRQFPKLLLTIGVIGNLGLLGYFKYANFFVDNVNTFAGSSFHLEQIVLPLAISFFTFQQIAYLVDAYKGLTKEYNFLHYCLFVTFFPQLIAGPIVHHSEMMSQFANRENQKRNFDNIRLGLFIFTVGLFKKVVIADTFAIWATEGFDGAESLDFFQAWVTSLSYTFQLYFDFSGYTDMAIGIALLFNIRLPQNFNSPYKALSIQDFWRRWHMTLSRFLRDYLYIPLGGNRKGVPRLYVNLFLTFLLGGIWHGAGWTFIAWGALHGIALIIHRLWGTLGITMHKLLAWFITFQFINITWVFFRAKTFEDAIKVLSGMFDFSAFTVPPDGWMQVIYIVVALIVVVSLKNSHAFKEERGVPFREEYKSWAALFLFSFAFLQMINIIVKQGVISEFLYFNF